MEISCVIIEDEPLASERMKDFVEKTSFLKLLGIFDNALDALELLSSNKVELVFLDVNLGEFSGVQLLESGLCKSKVILTTAYQEYALKAFDLNVADYLLKPFSFERFLQAVDRVRPTTPEPKRATPKRFIFVKTENRLEKVNLRDIVYIEGMGDYRRVHTVNKRIMTLQTFTDFEEHIPPNIVCRVHRSYMVSIDKIDSIEKDRIRVGEKYFPISEKYQKQFQSLIRDLTKGR